MAINLTDRAAQAIKDTIREHKLSEDATKLRVGVKGGGCSGFTYVLDLTEDEKSEWDEELECNGVKILCDQKSLLYLEGVEIDFKDDGMMSRGFAFRNPNATGTCGCGHSFQA